MALSAFCAGSEAATVARLDKRLDSPMIIRLIRFLMLDAHVTCGCGTFLV